MNIGRVLDLNKFLRRKTSFLFGARWTGKTFALNQQLDDSWLVINLLKGKFRLPLEQNPSELENMIRASGKKCVVIDEIQKIPELLDEVHALIEEQSLKFLLTGSSARKLRRGGVNLLGGRAQKLYMFPLTWYEISRKNDFELEHYLRFGGLPKVYLSQYPEDDLFDYVETYLREEIQAESIVRNLQGFSRFLNTAALNNGEILNYSKLGNDAQVSPTTVRDFFTVLEDTLVGFQLLPWKSPKRKSVQTSKFYFFDTGVANALAGVKVLDENSNLYGKSFEHMIINEIRAYLSYNKIKAPLYFWRTKDQLEVDLIIGDHTAIEIKSTKKTNKNHLKGLRKISEEKKWNHLFLVSRDTVEMKGQDGIHSIHWKTFFEKLWQGDIVIQK